MGVTLVEENPHPMQVPKLTSFMSRDEIPLGSALPLV
jgi:hypothetical protein